MPGPLRVPHDPHLPLCTSGKRPFRSEEEALKQLSNARYTRRENPTGRRHGGTEQRVHFCAACEHWHLTSSGGNKRQGRAAKERVQRRWDRRAS